MITIQSIILVLTAMVPFNEYPEELPSIEHTDKVCQAIALDAVNIGRIYIKNHSREEAARWVVNRTIEDHTYMIFAPGDLQIIITMSGVDINTKEDITRFALAVYDTCVTDNTKGWVQNFKPVSITTPKSPKVSM